MSLGRAPMSFFRPPYRNIHVLLLTSITLIAYVCVLLFFPFSTSKNRHMATVTPTNGALIKQDFKQPLALAQSGKFDAALIKDKFLMIDIRSSSDYQHAHIEGALSAPVDQLKGASFTLDTNLVVYSTSQADTSKAITILGDQGIPQIRVLSEPLATLSKAGYKITPHP
jgi:rhodanese-related sulfurtransferase